LHLSDRQVRRLRRRFEAEGAEGLLHRLRLRVAALLTPRTGTSMTAMPPRSCLPSKDVKESAKRGLTRRPEQTIPNSADQERAREQARLDAAYEAREAPGRARELQQIYDSACDSGRSASATPALLLQCQALYNRGAR
jgi:hypothetical protein